MSGVLLALMTLTTACGRDTGPRHEGHEEYREGYYDGEHQRWYHDHAWHDCAQNDEHCR